YDEGVQKRDGAALRHIAQQFFCSSSGDDALLALGDLALEAGNPGQARGYWERIFPPQYWARLAPPVVQANGSPVWLLYPDTDLDWADVRARLLLAAILEGDHSVAQRDLEVFARECGAAQGNMGGRQVNYAEFLIELLAESTRWPAEDADQQWPTLGGNFQRTKVFPRAIELGAVGWEAALPEMTVAETSAAAGSRRVAEKRDQLLSYHPVVVDNLVLVSTLDDVRAYDLATGEPMWVDSPEQPYFYKLPGERGELFETSRGGGTAMGAPRSTLTVHNRRVYVRLGSPVTSRSTDSLFAGLVKRSHVVCLDLDDEGSLIWNVSDALEEDVNDRSWAFEGSPVVDGDGVYVAMRRSGVRPQQYVVCLDPENGHLKWRRLICGAETPAQGQEEITHNLLTLHAGTLYANTNLGAVAAIDARDGQIRWITRYPRTHQVELSKRPKHFYRDLTPCIYYHGLVIAAPADSELLMALDAPTGLLVWQTSFADDVVHLLGMIDGKLVASGDRLWWIDALQGKIVSPPGTPRAESFPEGGLPKGFGRGVLAGNKVYWPTWDKIYIFDHQGKRQLDPIELQVRRAVGGNLVPAGDSLLIAAHDRIIVFRRDAAIPLAKP
ncbi:MAG: PQQ-binding-like beta-propeller repeat protein, partial [Pirellulales bacterium]